MRLSRRVETKKVLILLGLFTFCDYLCGKIGFMVKSANGCLNEKTFGGKFIKNKKYYTGVVYEWNLPTGITCPFAKECRVSVDRLTGKFNIGGGYFRCYAASAERFPAVRAHRWRNYEFVMGGGIPILPDDCDNVRIHASGDFFSQEPPSSAKGKRGNRGDMFREQPYLYPQP